LKLVAKTTINGD